MAQLIIDDLPDDVAERLRQRAALSGRSLENEARALLCNTPEQISSNRSNETLAMVMQRASEDAGLSEAAWHELDRSLLAARMSRSDSIHRWIDFDGPEFEPAEGNT